LVRRTAERVPAAAHALQLHASPFPRVAAVTANPLGSLPTDLGSVPAWLAHAAAWGHDLLTSMFGPDWPRTMLLGTLVMLVGVALSCGYIVWWRRLP
jgi:hypothetical protein